MQNKIINELTEMSTRIYQNIQSFNNNDVLKLETIFKLKSIEYNKIRSFNLEDSQYIVMLTVKQNAMILLKYLIINKIEIPHSLLDTAIDLLFDVKEPLKDMMAMLEKQRIEREIFYLIVDICYITKYINEKVKIFVREKTMPDEVSVNFALLVNGTYKSYELSVLNSLKIDLVLVNFIESYKNKMRKIVKETIIDELYKKLPCKDIKYIYSIFFMINDRCKKEFFEIEEVPCNEYIGFIASLVHTKESADFAFNKLKPYFDKLEEVFKQIIFFNKKGTNKMQDEDIKIIFYILTAIERISKYKSTPFIKYLGLFQEIIQFKLESKIKGVIYTILTNFLTDKDVFIKKQLDCKDEIENELKKKEFHLLPRVMKFINEYQKRKEYEEMLINTGKSIGSPYLNVDEPDIDFKIWGLKSEDPLTIIECFDGKLNYETIKLNLPQLRNTMLKNSNVIEKLLEYQINNKIIIRDISIINLILCTPSQYFFTYVRLFDDFSFYLNSDVLERIADNPVEGIRWLLEYYSKEIGQFIINNCNFFNSLLKQNLWLQIKLTKIYNKLIDDFIDKVEIKSESQIANDNGENIVDTLIVSDNEKFVSIEFFKIFAKQLIYKYFYKNKKINKNDLLGQFKTESYIEYVKAKLIVGYDITTDIHYLKSNLINIDDLIGLYNIFNDNYMTPLKSQSIIGNFGKKDTNLFTKYFQGSTELEKFILFFSLDKMNHLAENIIKDEIINNLKLSNKIYLDMCVVQLFKCNNLDNIIIILEKFYHNQQLLALLGLNNLANGGKYFSKQLLENLSRVYTEKALFFLYFNNIWEKEIIYQLVSKMDYLNSNELSLIIDDYKK